MRGSRRPPRETRLGFVSSSRAISSDTASEDPRHGSKRPRRTWQPDRRSSSFQISFPPSSGLVLGGKDMGAFAEEPTLGSQHTLRIVSRPCPFYAPPVTPPRSFPCRIRVTLSPRWRRGAPNGTPRRRLRTRRLCPAPRPLSEPHQPATTHPVKPNVSCRTECFE